MMRKFVIACAALALTACGQSTQEAPESGAAAPGNEIADGAIDEDVVFAPPEVEPGLLAAPSSTFVALEPSELGVFGAPSVIEALEPITGAPEMHEEGSTISMSVRESGEMTVADIVRANIPDDSVSAGHVRVEFRREAEGWYPTNAYRRWMCRRGERAGQWTTELCP